MSASVTMGRMARSTWSDTCLQCGETRTYSFLGECVEKCSCQPGGPTRRQKLHKRNAAALAQVKPWPDRLGGAACKVTINGERVEEYVDPWSGPSYITPTVSGRPYAGAKHERHKRRIAAIYRRDGRGCYYCGRLLQRVEDMVRHADKNPPADYPTIEHLTPRSLGGDNRLSNLAAACRSCNTKRGNVPLDEWAES